MIIRQDTRAFILIEQAKHGILAREVFQAICDDLLEDDPYRASVLEAIQSHDDGWAFVDQNPFWNDEKAMPFHFLDFPSQAKIPFYHYGIEQVSKRNAYAGALCSAHYARFLSNRKEVAASDFVEAEKARQNKILQNHPHADFQKHFALLRLADNLSLFLCLNEPKVQAENVHFFFTKGIAVPETLHKFLPAFIDFDWQDQLLLKGFGQVRETEAVLPYRRIEKNALAEKSLTKAYHETEEQYERIEIKTI